ncbi:NACHT domain-containing protein [Sphaerisporangium flaviroseum]|uniref:NACHT domain-containing protein n=1 Tax=Sphaerisporangium flaviroseum TaxID=509199 RepID=A0ABP7JGS8_9ACTN
MGALMIAVWRAWKPDAEVNLADVAAVALAAATAVTGVVVWARRPPTAMTTLSHAEVGTAAQVLADLIERQWRTEARRRLLDDPEPIPVHWQLTANEALMSHPRLITTDGELTFTGGSDDLPHLARRFRALTRRRLVITGGAGMGKTTLAVQLLLQLLSTRATDQATANPGEVVPVPVLLPVSGWDLDAHPHLHDWLTHRLTQDYPALATPQLGPGAAAALAHGGHILPILDGLDEIGEHSRTRVIEQLNASLTARDQLILTSRTTEFTTAITATGRPLTAAAIITPKLLAPDAAAGYLTACLPASPPPAWQQVLAGLAARTAPGLTQLAATPLGLWLIRTVYMAPDADPAPLIGPVGADADALRIHLLDRLVPAVIATRPPSTDPGNHFRPRHRLNPNATRRYLTYLAHAFPPATTRDITWWHIPRTTPHIRPLVVLTVGLPVGLVAGLVIGLAGGLLFGLAFGLVTGFALRVVAGFRGGLVFGLVAGLVYALLFILVRRLVGGWVFGVEFKLPFGLVLGVVFGLLVGVAADSWVDETPGFANLRLRGRRRLLLRSIVGQFVGGFLGGLGFGLAFGLVFGLAFGFPLGLAGGPVIALASGLTEGLVVALAFGLAFGLVFGLVAGLITWAEQPTLTSNSTPLSTWRTDKGLLLLRVLPSGIGAGLAFGLVFEVVLRPVAQFAHTLVFQLGVKALYALALEFVYGLPYGLVGGVAVGLVYGLVAGKHHAWLVCIIAVARLALARRLPWKVMDFLDDAHRLGLLRTVGPVYQFRHAALHDYLATTPTP